MTTATLEITQPGVYDGMPADVYIGDPVPGGSLSSTGARKLLPPSCPAAYRWWADNGEAPKRVYDFGHAAHLEVLGAGPAIAALAAKDWKTKAAQEFRDKARAEGYVPLLVHEHDQILDMAIAIRRHPIASALFNPDHGKPEQSLFWQDHETGQWCRSRLDWLPSPNGGRTILTDYKTTNSAAPDAISRAVYNYGYYMQAPFYLTGAAALDLADADAAFLFVFQENTPPYLVNVVELDSVALMLGHRRNRQAIDLYADCKAHDEWPGYSTDIDLISLPPWAERQLEP